MKLSNNKIVNSASQLEGISKKQLPVKVSYAIAKNMRKLNDLIKIYNDERQKLITKYGIKDENEELAVGKDGIVHIKEECMREWAKDNTELFNIEVEVDIHTFSIDNFKGYDMAPSEMMAIEYMIKD